MTGISDAALLAGAGVVAGLVGTAGGITSLVSYPALLAAGLPALAANIANGVALVACWPGAAVASRPELAGQAGWLRRWLPVPALGGLAGSILLLTTPPGAFARIVPFLVATGAVALLAQPWLTAYYRQHRERRPVGARTVILPFALTATAVYDGYFGAGSGVMILALLLVTVQPQLPIANALKNMLLGASTLISAAAFATLGPVDWSAVVPLGAGLLVGSALGPRAARRLPAALLRWVVALIGIGFAIRLWITAPG